MFKMKIIKIDSNGFPGPLRILKGLYNPESLSERLGHALDDPGTWTCSVDVELSTASLLQEATQTWECASAIDTLELSNLCA